jgi:hypothetical protein
MQARRSAPIERHTVIVACDPARETAILCSPLATRLKSLVIILHIHFELL